MVSVIRLKNGRLEFLKKDGEWEFPITLDFWDWWKKAISYIDGDSVDICYIYDKDYDFLHEEFVENNNALNTEGSSWNLEYIKSYFWKLKPTYFSISIIGLSEQEYNLGGDGSTSKYRKRFYTNLNFKATEVANIKVGAEEKLNAEVVSKPIDENDFSPVAKFFVDMIRRERG